MSDTSFLAQGGKKGRGKEIVNRWTKKLQSCTAELWEVQIWIAIHCLKETDKKLNKM